MVSSTGAGSGKPARASTIMSNLAFWKIFSTDGSVSSGPSTLDRVGQRRPARRAPRARAARSRRGRPRWPATSRPGGRASGPAPSVSVSSATTPAARGLGDPARSASAVVTRLIRSEAGLVGGGSAAGSACSAELGLRRPGSPPARLAGGRAVQAQARDVLRKPCAVQPAPQLRPVGSRRPQRCPAAAAAARPRAAAPARARCRAFSACSISMSRRLDGFIAGAAASTVSRSPNSLISCGGALRADAGHARHVVGRVADQRLHLDHLLGRDAELLHHLGRADRLLLDRVQHLHAGPDQLHQVLVGGDDGDLAAGLPSRPRHRRRSGRRPPSPASSIAGTPNASVASRTRANCGIRSSGGGGRCAL